MIDYIVRHLVMVSAGANNNKYYDMIPNGDRWIAEYGRIGSTFQKRNYNKYEYESKYKEKLRKGYVDQTDLVRDLIHEKPRPKSPYKEIENPSIREIVRRLQQMAHDAIEANYTISSNKVTQTMVDEAQGIIDNLLSVNVVEQFNEMLLKLFRTIPRKMTSVYNFLASDVEDFSKIISREQDLLDVMKGHIIQAFPISVEDAEVEVNNHTILDALGLEITECTNSDIAKIKVALGNCSDKFYNAWAVTNKQTQSKFDSFVKENGISDIRLLFHGSRNENWWSIIQSGLVLRPTNAIITGKMFGYGIYYAPKAKKSLGYTSLNGSYWAYGNSNVAFMGLMSVAYGKPFDVYSYDSRYSSLNFESLQRLSPGSYCLHAHEGCALRNDEIIVYKAEQSTIKYLVELRD